MKSTSPFQFSLLQLMIAVTLVSAAVGLIVWRPLLGSLSTVAVASLLLTVAGVKTRRKGLVFCGLALLLFGVGLFGYSSLTVATWVGWQELDVYVLVIDTDTFQPVPRVQIELLDGPYSPLEGIVSTELMTQFTPARIEPDVGQLITDSRGECKFTHRFRAAGTDGLFRHCGYIDTSNTWLRASSADRGSVMLPIDGQSARPRNIDDKTPVFVTVPLREQH
ncbi:MAG: hypothetical protein ACYSWU_07775 [Planctomycetota bacterium]